MTSALLALAVGMAAAAGPVEVAARAARTEVTVGERFTVEVEASGPAGARFEFPEKAGDDRVELVAVAAQAAARPGGDEAPPPNRMTYQAAVFAIEDVVLPPVAVRWTLPDGRRGETASAPVPLTVRSLLPADEAERTLADVRPPVGVKVAPVFWLTYAALLAAVAAGVLLLARRRRAGTAPALAAVPEQPPDVEARAALDVLAGSGLLERTELREYYIRLAVVAKRYLERRLGAPVLEMTSAELTRTLREHCHGAELLPVVRDVTAAADMVKFARSPGEVEVARRQLAAVRGIVETLEQRLAAASAAAAEQAAAGLGTTGSEGRG